MTETPYPTRIEDGSPDLHDMEGAPGMTYRLLIDSTKVPSASLCHGIFYMEPEAEEASHTHDVSETIYVLSGRGYVRLDDDKVTLAPGDMVYIPPGTAHGFYAEEEMQVHFTFPVDCFDDVAYHDAT